MTGSRELPGPVKRSKMRFSMTPPPRKTETKSSARTLSTYTLVAKSYDVQVFKSPGALLDRLASQELEISQESDEHTL